MDLELRQRLVSVSVPMPVPVLKPTLAQVLLVFVPRVVIVKGWVSEEAIEAWEALPELSLWLPWRWG